MIYFDEASSNRPMIFGDMLEKKVVRIELFQNPFPLVILYIISVEPAYSTTKELIS